MSIKDAYMEYMSFQYLNDDELLLDEDLTRELAEAIATKQATKLDLYKH